jgi:hypothetical protein
MQHGRDFAIKRDLPCIALFSRAMTFRKESSRFLLVVKLVFLMGVFKNQPEQETIQQFDTLRAAGTKISTGHQNDNALQDRSSHAGSRGLLRTL